MSGALPGAVFAPLDPEAHYVKSVDSGSLLNEPVSFFVAPLAWAPHRLGRA